MGLQWERQQRRDLLEKTIVSAFAEAMNDAECEYDDLDYAAYEVIWTRIMDDLTDFEIPEGPKELK